MEEDPRGAPRPSPRTESEPFDFDGPDGGYKPPIVLLDDGGRSLDDAEDLAAILAESGYAVHRAPLDSASMAFVAVRQPGLVIACGDDRGDAAAALTRELQRFLGAVAPPVVVATGLNDDAGMRTLLTAGVRDVISTPVLPALVRVKVTQHLRQTGLPSEPIGGFVVKRRLGVGGMGAVYLAADGAGEVALKVIDLKMAQVDPELLVRFRREADILKNLKGRGAPSFHGSGRSGDTFWCAMELVRGSTLNDVLAHGPLPQAQVRQLIVDLATALAEIHGVGIVHRDIKPANIMIVKSTGRATLIDFGLARAVADRSLTSSSVVLGTSAYMAPEVLAGATVSGGADAFALGMTALEALLGFLPMEGSPMEVGEQLLAGKVPEPDDLVPDADPALRRVLRQLLAPNLRYRLPLPEAIRWLSTDA